MGDLPLITDPRLSLTSSCSLSLLLIAVFLTPLLLSSQDASGSGRYIQANTQHLRKEPLPIKLTNLREGSAHPQENWVPFARGLGAVAAHLLCSISQLNTQNRTLCGAGPKCGVGVIMGIIGAAVVELLVSLGSASWGVTRDISIPSHGTARLTAGISSTCSNCSRSCGHWYARHLVVDLTLGSHGLLSYLGLRALNITNTDSIL